MGVKSKNRAEKRKEEKKTLYYAKLNNCPTSPRKMRLIADMIRGKKVELALVMLKNSPQVSSDRLISCCYYNYFFLFSTMYLLVLFFLLRVL